MAHAAFLLYLSNKITERQGADVTNANEEDLFDVALDNAAKTSDRRDGSSKPNFKRQKKDNKYGFGGKKRHSKSNDAASTSNARSFSMSKMKGKPSGGASKRPGKSRRNKS
jgi:rRNA-processing protein EBP2